MSKENKTNWKKNNDSRYISGEDLQSSLKGLAPEMVVVIDKFEDAETFDQNNQKNIIKTGLFLKDLNGKIVYKPLILNNTNGKFCAKEFASEFMEDWVGKPVTLYAQKDKRHGYVARLKKYYGKPIEQKPVASEEDVKIVLEQMELIQGIDGLKSYWEGLDSLTKEDKRVVAAKETAKTRLS